MVEVDMAHSLNQDLQSARSIRTVESQVMPGRDRPIKRGQEIAIQGHDSEVTNNKADIVHIFGKHSLINHKALIVHLQLAAFEEVSSGRFGERRCRQVAEKIGHLDGSECRDCDDLDRLGRLWDLPRNVLLCHISEAIELFVNSTLLIDWGIIIVGSNMASVVSSPIGVGSGSKAEIGSTVHHIHRE